ncbi:hypothetical protein KRX51_00955 [Corynebacterium sp. TAE3-ERU12]|uniref:septum site-determining protein Ssd n=1 Tax=Corynebacterium sp. TAE3-ERU12 TaxID=2849491 RepID=UPI001C473F36|nr:septum site-determining protein Ssd [Corynebacterium sp. TAE3-ERU12]MBV7294487.1 hypothetical protein [Corynebacterium sp. TAE3-ERU12]
MSAATPPAESTPEILIATAQACLREEATAIAAASGHASSTVATPDPAGGAWRRAAAILIDAPTAQLIAADGAHNRRDAVFLIHDDTEEPDLRAALNIGAEQTFALPSGGARLIEHLGRPERGSGDGLVLALIGAAGGAGTSVTAAACALASAYTWPTVLIDADELSGGADLLLGMEHIPGVRWPDIRTGGRIDSAALIDALPRSTWASGGPGLITMPRARGGVPESIASGAVGAVADAVVAHGGVGVVDLPRRGEVLADILPRADIAAVVVPRTVRGIAASVEQARMVRALGPEPVAIATGPAPGGVCADDIEYATDMSVVATMPWLRGLAAEIEHTGLARSSSRLADAVRGLIDTDIAADEAHPRWWQRWAS